MDVIKLRRLLAVLIAATAGAVASGAAVAATPGVYTARFSDLAVGGYDAVSFFDASGPLKGVAAYATEHEGAAWRFASAANLEKFKADPSAYAPQYGGYCAWAVAQGKTAPGDPKYWTVVDGKLFLNYDAKVQRDWEKDIPGFIVKANANWPGVLAK